MPHGGGFQKGEIMQDLLDDIHGWAVTTFPHQTALSKVAHLTKEVAELREAIESGEREEMRKEWADCAILLLNTATMMGMDWTQAQSAIEEKMRINKSRRWGSPDKDGVCHHIKEDR